MTALVAAQGVVKAMKGAYCEHQVEIGKYCDLCEEDDVLRAETATRLRCIDIIKENIPTGNDLIHKSIRAFANTVIRKIKEEE